MIRLLMAYFTWRYGGLPGALPVPLGWPPRRFGFRPPPLRRRFTYYARRALWRLESWIYALTPFPAEWWRSVQ